MPVVSHKPLDYVFPKVCLVVEDVVRDVELGRDPPGILGVGKRATSSGRRLSIRPLPELKSGAYDIVTLGLDQGGRHR
jgi:hypothetical protein